MHDTQKRGRNTIPRGNWGRYQVLELRSKTGVNIVGTQIKGTNDRVLANKYFNKAVKTVKVREELKLHQIILHAGSRIRTYDLKRGKEI